MSADFRPMHCTMRLRDEGLPAPRSCCVVCGNGGLAGCPKGHCSPPATEQPANITLHASAQ